MKFKTTIGNLNRTQDGIRCDRLSLLGSPFRRKDESQRILGNQGFRKYLFEVAVHNNDPQLVAKQIRIENGLSISPRWLNPSAHVFQDELTKVHMATLSSNTTLLCWCEPLPCHCEILVKYFNWKNERYRDWNEWLDSLQV